MVQQLWKPEQPQRYKSLSQIRVIHWSRALSKLSPSGWSVSIDGADTLNLEAGQSQKNNPGYNLIQAR